MKIRTRGSQAFNVPNDEEGHVFLKLLRKFRNRGWHYRARGRGSRKEHGCQHGIGQEHSEWMAVYLDGTKAKQYQQQRLNEIYQLQSPVAFQDLSLTSDPLPSIQVHTPNGPVNVAPPAGQAGQTFEIYHGIPLQDFANYCGCDPAAGFKCIEHNDPQVDEVDLTPAEQELLEDILNGIIKGYYYEEHTLGDKKEAFESLFNKLVD